MWVGSCGCDHVMRVDGCVHVGVVMRCHGGGCVHDVSWVWVCS